jgi:hypothetical protein
MGSYTVDRLLTEVVEALASSADCSPVITEIAWLAGCE